MKKKCLLLMMLSAAGLASVAQQPPISHIEINNVRGTILGNGTYLVPQRENYDQNGNVLPDDCLTWEVPEGSGKQTIFQHALWLGGLDATDGLHLAAYRFGNSHGGGEEFYLGPLKTTDASIDWMTSLKFHRVWNLTRAEIDQFIANHGNAGYQVPDDILTWPAHGEAGYAENLAPFVDVNNDGHYNPADGDYPDIKGDQCLFFIFNDSFKPHYETNVYLISYYAITYLLSGFYPELVKTQGAAARLDDFILFNLIFLVLLMIVRNLLPGDFTPVLFLMIYLPWMVYRGTDNLFVKKEKVPRFVVISSALLLGLPMVLKLILDLFIIK